MPDFHFNPKDISAFLDLAVTWQLRDWLKTAKSQGIRYVSRTRRYLVYELNTGHIFLVGTRKGGIGNFVLGLISSAHDWERDMATFNRMGEVFFRRYEEALDEVMFSYGEPDFFLSDFNLNVEYIKRFLNEYEYSIAFASWDRQQQQLQVSLIQ